jgi:hypothetical protein
MANGKRRRYTDEERASCVVMLEAQGYPNHKGALTSVAKYAKVPINTLRGWYIAKHSPPPTELRNQKRQDIADRLEGIVHALLDHVDRQFVIAEMSGQQAMTSAAIGIDKMRLLRDQSTENRKQINLNVNYSNLEDRHDSD